MSQAYDVHDLATKLNERIAASGNKNGIPITLGESPVRITAATADDDGCLFVAPYKAKFRQGVSPSDIALLAKAFQARALTAEETAAKESLKWRHNTAWWS